MKSSNSLGKQVQRNIVTGLIVLAPLTATVLILKSLYDWLKDKSPFQFVGGTFVTLAIITLIVFMVGWLSRTALGSILDHVDEWLARFPGVGIIYKSVRDLVNAISGEEARFRHPVWVKPIPGSPLKFIGFVTREDLAQLGLKGEVAVYLPDSYNISGKLVILPRKAVKPVKTNSKDLFAFVATAGLTGGHAHDRSR